MELARIRSGLVFYRTAFPADSSAWMHTVFVRLQSCRAQSQAFPFMVCLLGMVVVDNPANTILASLPIIPFFSFANTIHRCTLIFILTSNQIVTSGYTLNRNGLSLADM